MAAIPSVDGLGTLSSKFAVLSQIRAGTSGGASSLTLKGYKLGDGAKDTSAVLQYVGTQASLVLSANGGTESVAVTGCSGIRAGADGGVTFTAFNPANEAQDTVISMRNIAGTPTISLAGNGLATPAILTGVATPNGSTDAVNKSYVDDRLAAAAAGFSAKNSAEAIIRHAFVPDGGTGTTVNISNATLFGADAIVFGGASLVVNGKTVNQVTAANSLTPANRVLLLFDETASVYSGVYYVSNYTGTSAVLTRAIDMDEEAAALNEIRAGVHVFSAGAGYVLTAIAPEPLALGASTITFSKFSDTNYTAGGTLITVNNTTHEITLNSGSTSGGLVMISNGGTDEPTFSNAIGPVLPATYAELLTTTDPGLYDGTVAAGGFVLGGPVGWGVDGTSVTQPLYLGNPTATGSMRALLKDDNVGGTAHLEFQRWTGAAWVALFSASPQ